MAHDALEITANVLEKTAEYVEAMEQENRSLKEAQQQEQAARTEAEAEKLAEALKQATGEDVDPTVAKKIASSDDEEVKELIHKIASVEEVDSLGSARRRSSVRSKMASSEDDPDAEFGNWILNG